MTTPFNSIIIIGAGRSGTNMLRGMLTSVPGAGTWPCDEINYIWRHGNAGYPTDELPPGLATERVSGYIRRQFQKIASRYQLTHVVEKTCANSLRVSFVDRVFSQARFIHILRDGRDAALSATQRWTAPMNLPYVLKKARFVPPTDLPYYASRHCWNQIIRFFSREQRLSFWGPRFEGMHDIFSQYPLPVACAIQWKTCVEAATLALQKIDSARVCQVRYEDLVTDPAEHLERILQFVRIPASQTEILSAVAGVFAGSVGRWRTVLDGQILDAVVEHIGPTLQQFSYDV